MKWYWIALIVVVVLFVLYKLAKYHPKTVQFIPNADGTSTSYITTPTQQMQIVHDSNGNIQTMRVEAVTNMPGSLSK